MVAHSAAAARPLSQAQLEKKESFADASQSGYRLGLDEGGASMAGDSAGPPSREVRAVRGRAPSALVFAPPENQKLRFLMHGFIDLYKKHVEAPYTFLLKAPNPDAAAVRWSAFCHGLKELNTYLETNASRDGPLFLGDEPCMVEAAIAPALFRMVAVLVRGEIARLRAQLQVYVGHRTLNWQARADPCLTFPHTPCLSLFPPPSPRCGTCPFSWRARRCSSRGCWPSQPRC